MSNLVFFNEAAKVIGLKIFLNVLLNYSKTSYVFCSRNALLSIVNSQ